MENTFTATPRIAIIGSGPSGCYTAQYLRKKWSNAEIVIFDRLHEPFGLLRYGVAPDHLGTKGIAKQFERLFTRDGVEFRGGVEVGRDIPLDDIRSKFDIVVFATGLWGDRTIDCFQNEGGGPICDGVYGSGRLTRMINGFPRRDSAQVRLGRRTTIIGNGNVAVDLVRLILSAPETLAEFGVPQDAIDALRADGPVERIDVIGRSAARSAKFDPAMVRELGRLTNVRFQLDPDEIDATGAEAESLKKLEALSEIAELPADGDREVHFHFGWTPKRLEGSDRVEQVTFADTAGERNDLVLDTDSVCTAVGFTEVANDVLLRSDLETEQADVDSGVLGGGMYCVGWVRRGPVGTIPANRTDAAAVSKRIIADVEAGAVPITSADVPAPTQKSSSAVDRNGGMVVLYGTESGNAEAVADLFIDEFSGDLEVQAIDMTDATAEDLRTKDLVVVICSTHGEGAMPSSALPFAQLLDTERPDLAGTTYGMFGMGDSSYEFYSRGSEHIDERLAALGATRVGAYGRHDASDGTLPNDSALKWVREILAEEMVTSDAGSARQAHGQPAVIGAADGARTEESAAVASSGGILSGESASSQGASVAERTTGITTAVHTDRNRIPADLTLHYDPFSYADYDAPYDLFKRLRDEAPVYHNKELDIYFVSRYADVRAILADTKRFSSRFGNDIDGTHDSFGEGFLVTLDPPRHTALRAAIRRTFSVREILAKEDGMREYIRSLLEPFWAEGGGDFTSEVGLPTGVGMAVMLLGRPMSDVPAFVDHIERELVRVVGATGVPDDAISAVEETEEMIAERFANRKAEIEAGIDPRASDAMTQITLAVHAGKVMPEEQVGLAHLVLGAASDAPAAFLSQIIMVLDRFPGLQPYLRENPSMVPAFIEECLRYDTPAQNLSRQTTEEVEVAGTVIPADSRVTLLQGSANRDERVFEKPEVFDIAREITPANRIMTFGEGPHACMGAPFLRLSSRVLVEELVQGPDLRIVGLPERFSKQLIRGFAKLPVKVKE